MGTKTKEEYDWRIIGCSTCGYEIDNPTDEQVDEVNNNLTNCPNCDFFENDPSGYLEVVLFRND